MSRVPYCFVFVVIIMLTVTHVSARSDFSLGRVEALSSDTFWIESLSWKSFALNCRAGDLLRGDFAVVQDGDLFIGDQTKYDNWLHRGIDFFICNESSYASWVDGQPVNTLISENNIHRLTWNTYIPQNGPWFIVYYNPSIYMKEIESSYINVDSDARMLVGATVLSILVLVPAFATIRVVGKRSSHLS